ncbi:hypothetical protein BN7_5423 [Wickerhamomyces ciferrii]|uniref:tRNA (adenine(58)-N(1))-methyltransferase catalytic subunit TRM61 n=1 Tax=Wickerhamomyces ciferrii (strain ATCC 14091 / BCRC 22168 / CBS 111 / JCM 3599 / NBRC 0793 / NRRL Y-1031 F-60-10) TaxID=1206466 RepID=K0KVA9_WICCF|nr:uncharacterized protein BN7_5423 [Wickerhamomyces ciferrii]CCH45837.1 hypothetical protein BN7_5423 [Wickerhamomyces ciferrii]
MLQRRWFSSFKAGDVALLRSIVRADKFWLTNPLVSGGKTNVFDGHIKHDDIVGLKSRSIVKSSSEKSSFIVTQASTEDYINLSKRSAQPIYPYDAAAIANLADFHFDYPELDEDNKLVDSPIQLLEAGTGHGSLSLALCSKIHPLNCFNKKFGARGGILHTIDHNKLHSERGQLTIRNFRRGIYEDNVEYHVANSPSEWLQNEAESWRSLEKINSNEDQYDGFLSGAFLDMPNFHLEVEQIAKDLKQDAPLIVFCPSVTQILDLLNVIRQSQGDIKLTHTQTIQLTPGMGGGLQDWEVRYTNIRVSGEVGVICRPKVGTKVVGGGFIGIFKKLSNNANIKPKYYNQQEESNIKTQY